MVCFNSLPVLGNFVCAFDIKDFQNQLFRKVISGIPSVCQTVWIQIRPDVLSDLIQVKGSKLFAMMVLHVKN